jgi:hypothetical protein
MNNIHILPTEKPSRLHLGNSGLVLCDLNFGKNTINGQHIYITNSEEIKEGDWVYNIVSKTKFKATKQLINLINNPNVTLTTNKKIILTTDKDLIADGVQAIDEKFLEWYVKNPSCEGVEVTKGSFNLSPMEEMLENEYVPKGTFDTYKIIIPKEEPKQEIVGYKLKPSIDRMMVDGILKNAMPIWNDEDKSVYFIKGHIGGSLVAKMKELQVLDLWFTPIYENEEVKSDWVKEDHLEYYHKKGIMSDKPKQETTLEEAAEKAYRFEADPMMPDKTEHQDFLRIFKKGAKYQAERMYSEEDLKKAFFSGCQSERQIKPRIKCWEQWIEKFKKK